ncbi:phage integrase family protein [Cupriavidus plantarum]|uniref:phage integrase family protein n=1 Tax=Cupriavidus plantarum TaxID=942865 RepID=UPI000EACCD03|nr:phage integrase family protein [Cupriavidus plantarum]RLK31098.1 putative integrase protein [Cupriavidus plantarum]
MSEDRDTLAATKLTRTEFAVVRAYAQGMRPVDIANRYLVDPDDDDVLTEAQAIVRILALRDRLVQFALQHDRPDIADMFEALRGRSDVGMTRRVDALSSLEQLGQGRPQQTHEVGLWFGPSLARRLTAAGLLRIADLTALANRRGSSWWRAVPRLGPKSADTITRWLIQQGSFDGPRSVGWVRPYVKPPLSAPPRKPLRGMPLARGMAYPVPLEHMRPAVHVSQEALHADVQWVRQWLARPGLQPHTFKSYRREAERLLLWLASQGRTLAGIDSEMLIRYAAFLQDPQPAAFWCGPAGARDAEYWRPFEGPLSPASQQAALRVVRALTRAAYRDGRVAVQPSRPATPSATAPRATAHREPDDDGEEENGGASLTAQTIAEFLDWLVRQADVSGRAAPGDPLLADRRRVALVAAHLVRQGATLGDIAAWRCRDSVPVSNDTEAAIAGALAAHWNARGIDARTMPEAPLLAPLHVPHTGRAAARHAAGTLNGYSPSGLDQLLRGAWKDYARECGGWQPPFTPRKLRLGRVRD